MKLKVVVLILQSLYFQGTGYCTNSPDLTFNCTGVGSLSSEYVGILKSRDLEYIP